MSLFLGKIHYWLFNKILWFQDLEDEVMELAKNEKLNTNEINNNLNITFEEKITNKNLEEIINTENIHGWLQNRINISEGRFSYLVKEILENCDNPLKKLEVIFQEKGVKDAHEINLTTKISNAKEIYTSMNNLILDGMPCDRVNEIIDLEDDFIKWKRVSCAHSSIWNSNKLDVNIFYNLRTLWIKEFIKNLNSDYIYMEENNFFTIRRKDAK